MIGITKQRTLCQISLSQVDNQGMKQAKKNIPSRKKKNMGTGCQQSSLEAAEGQGRVKCKRQMRVWLDHAMPCTLMNDFSPLSKGEAAKGSANRVRASSSQILRADPCPSKIYKLIITLLKMHEVYFYSDMCAHTSKKGIKTKKKTYTVYIRSTEKPLTGLSLDSQ